MQRADCRSLPLGLGGACCADGQDGTVARDRYPLSSPLSSTVRTERSIGRGPVIALRDAYAAVGAASRAVPAAGPTRLREKVPLGSRSLLGPPEGHAGLLIYIEIVHTYVNHNVGMPPIEGLT